jgi:hypothetical protein
MDDMEKLLLNRELAERVLREVLAAPSSPYAGKVLGIANAQLVLVGDDLDATFRRLREIEPNKLRGCYFEPRAGSSCSTASTTATSGTPPSSASRGDGLRRRPGDRRAGSLMALDGSLASHATSLARWQYSQRASVSVSGCRWTSVRPSIANTARAAMTPTDVERHARRGSAAVMLDRAHP